MERKRRQAVIEFILYVSDQERSKQFYTEILAQPPVLDVPGMTEFLLSPNYKLGLMPNHGIAKLIGDALPNPALGAGIPRCELYLHVEDAEERYQLAIQAGAKPVSPPSRRDWGDTAGYVADPDGHVIAFASQ